MEHFFVLYLPLSRLGSEQVMPVILSNRLKNVLRTQGGNYPATTHQVGAGLGARPEPDWWCVVLAVWDSCFEFRFNPHQVRETPLFDVRFIHGASLYVVGALRFPSI